MAELKRYNGQPIIDYMARDYDSVLKAMHDMVPYKLPEWQEHDHPADFGNTLLQAVAHLGDLINYYMDRVAGESLLGTAQTRRSIIHHLNLIGYRLSTAGPASAELRVSVPLAAAGVLTLQRGTAFATASTPERPSVRFEYNGERPFVIDLGEVLPADPDDATRKIFTLPIEEGRLVAGELLGTSDGTPNQRFPLAHRRLILRSLDQAALINRDVILLTDLGGGIDEWTLQESLAFSREDQQDFTLTIDENDQAAVHFGDGAFGAIPPAGATITITYRTGGGGQGNVPARTIETISDAPLLNTLGATITNLTPATNGADRETIAHAVAHAPGVFRSLKRAVTAADYENLALNFQGVGKVRAEKGHWNLVRLFVAPQGGGFVSDLLQANLLAYFEDKRPLSTLIEIEDVDYVPVLLDVTIEVESYYSSADMQEQAVQAAAALLAFEAVDFARPVYLSKFYEVLEDIEGILFVNITTFQREDAAATDPPVHPEGKLVMHENEIPIVGRVAVTATGGY